MEKLIKCTKCGADKLQSEFFKDKQKKTGYRPDCKECNIAATGTWQKNNPEKRKDYVTKSATGVTKLQYIELLELQNNRCAICGNLNISTDKRLSIDHCHEDMLVRGLLCTKCNFGLGYFNDNEDLLNKAIEYLHKNYKDKFIKYKS